MFGHKRREMQAINSVAQQRAKHTPDIATLELSEFQPVFIFDDLMLSGKNYKIIREHSARVARAFSQRGYNFYQRRIDSQPVAMTAKKVDNRFDFSCLKIKGELHVVESVSGMVALDLHYQNGVQFKRVETKLLYPTRQHGVIINQSTNGKPLPYTLQGQKHFLLPERVDIITAWMYIGMPSYWNDLLDGGFSFEPVRIVEPREDKSWLPKYYHYEARK